MADLQAAYDRLKLATDSYRWVVSVYRHREIIERHHCETCSCIAIDFEAVIRRMNGHDDS